MAMKVKISVSSLFFIVLAVSYAHSSANEILIFAGAASKPSTEFPTIFGGSLTAEAISAELLNFHRFRCGFRFAWPFDSP